MLKLSFNLPLNFSHFQSKLKNKIRERPTARCVFSRFSSKRHVMVTNGFDDESQSDMESILETGDTF